MKILMIFLITVIACASTISGLLLIIQPTGQILQLPKLMHVTPFNNYLLPGIFLLIIVGGINWVAVLINLSNNNKRYDWAIASSITSFIWIIIQIFSIPNLYWIHFIFLAISIMILLIANQQKGKWLL